MFKFFFDRDRKSPTPAKSFKFSRISWLLLFLPIALGLARLRLDVDIFNLLPASLETVQGLKLYQEHFAGSRELILVLESSDPERSARIAQSLATELRRNKDLVQRVFWQPPWREHPQDSAELVAYLWLNQPPAELQSLARQLDQENLPKRIAAVKERLTYSLSPGEIARASYDPFGLTDLPASTARNAPAFQEGDAIFASPDGGMRLLFVQAGVELTTYRQCQEWLQRIQAIVALTVASESGTEVVTVGYTGRPAFVSEIARQMEQDMSSSAGLTALIISALFWLAHRRIKPMLWLVALLGLVLAGTLALGGLIYGSINVVSMGFAAILLGLAVDYAVVHYQEAQAHPKMSIPQIRRNIAPSITWAALTTIAAFLLLNFGGLPGLGQLGTLVALGVGLAAVVMVFAYLPPLFPDRLRPDGTSMQREPAELSEASPPSRLQLWIVGGATTLLLLITVTPLIFGTPQLDATAQALRPRSSEAYATMERVRRLLGQERDPLWLILRGSSESEIASTLFAVEPTLSRAVTNAQLEGYLSVGEIWPRPMLQQSNLATVRTLLDARPALREAAVTAGFSAPALAYTDQILDTWQRAALVPVPFWPTNSLSQWIFEKFLARTETNLFVLLYLQPAAESGQANAARIAQLRGELPKQGVWLSGWEMLGTSILTEVQAHLWKITIPMGLIVLGSLWFAFRRASEVCLSVLVLSLSLLCLLAVMRLFGWSWNLLNLMAIPLILGTGVDYGIFMQLGLRRAGGNASESHRSVGRALLLCGGTAIAGFAALSLSSNAGMASLGQVCATGIAANMLISIFLLPAWWQIIHLRQGKPTAHLKPSSLYRANLWRWGLRLVRLVPTGLVHCLSHAGARIYYLLAHHRRAIIQANLLPIVKDRAAARTTARQMLSRFSEKLVDLWRYEAGLPIDKLFGNTSGWHHFDQASRAQRGILLLTPHLGNWEFGGPWLAQRGVKLQVITLSEPGADEEFTRLRERSRARWNIETLVIRNDPFAFLEIIRRLHDGATVALLIDRPPPPTAVTVELFQRPFPASIAAAELARASGCVLLPVYIPRVGEKYEAHILPPIDYDRATLRDRQHRQELTQRILRVFEPVIARHPDQWYHFVPVWPEL